MKHFYTLFLLITFSQAWAQNYTDKWIVLDTYKMDSTIHHIELQCNSTIKKVEEIKIVVTQGSIIFGDVLFVKNGAIYRIALNDVISSGESLDITDWFSGSVYPTIHTFPNATPLSPIVQIALVARIKEYKP